MTKEELERERMFGTINLKMAMIQRQAMENECLKDENTELMAQIEKMKCCANCENYCQKIDHRCNTECKNHSLWKLNEDFGWRMESN